MANYTSSSAIGSASAPLCAHTTPGKALNVGHRIAHLETHLKKVHANGHDKSARSNRGSTNSLTAYVDAMLADLKSSHPEKTLEVAAQQSSLGRTWSGLAAVPPPSVVTPCMPSAVGSQTAPSRYSTKATGPPGADDSEAKRPYSQWNMPTQLKGLQMISPRRSQSRDQTPSSSGSIRPVQSARAGVSSVTRQNSFPSTSPRMTRPSTDTGLGMQRSQSHLHGDTRANASGNCGSSQNSWKNSDADTSQKKAPLTNMLWYGPRSEADNLQLTSPRIYESLPHRQQCPARSSPRGLFQSESTPNISALTSTPTALLQSQSAACIGMLAVTPPTVPLQTQSATTMSMASVSPSPTALFQSQSTPDISMPLATSSSAALLQSQNMSNSAMLAVPGFPTASLRNHSKSGTSTGAMKPSPTGPIQNKNTLTQSSTVLVQNLPGSSRMKGAATPFPTPLPPNQRGSSLTVPSKTPSYTAELQKHPGSSMTVPAATPFFTISVPNQNMSTTSTPAVPTSLARLLQSQSMSNLNTPAVPPSYPTIQAPTIQAPLVTSRSMSLPPQSFPNFNTMENGALSNSAGSARCSTAPRSTNISGSFVAPVSTNISSSFVAPVSTKISGSFVAPVSTNISGSFVASASVPIGGCLAPVPRSHGSSLQVPAVGQCTSTRKGVTMSSSPTPGASFVAAAPQASFGSFSTPIGLDSSHAVNHVKFQRKHGKGGVSILPPPVPAFKFKADCSDMIDMTLSWTLCKLDPTSSSSLWLRRLAPGKYEIDGRRVTVGWSGTARKKQKLVASEDDVPGSVPIPVLDYLKQAASVASSMQTGRSRHPKVERGWEPSEFDIVDPDRVVSMVYACSQAGVKVHQRNPSRAVSEDSD